MLKNQLFGVEVEMTGITREKAARLVAEVLGTTPSHPESNCYHTRTIADQAARKWKIMRDSSIEAIRNDGTSEPLDEYRVEFVTPPLNYSDIELLQNIIRKLRENGAKAHSSCGIHIHVDGANHTAVSLRRLVNFMTARQDLIYEALQIGDRESNWCHKLNKTLLDAMKKDKNLTKEKAEEIWYSRANDGYCGGIDHQHYNATRYHGVNLHSFFTKGTVEFRLFNSTLHAGNLESPFCNIMLSLLHASLSAALPLLSSPGIAIALVKSKRMSFSDSPPPIHASSSCSETMSRQSIPAVIGNAI